MDAQLLVNQVELLFSLPEVALRVNEVLNSPDPLNSELEEIISSDPAFTAKILKIVNSAYFCFPGNIDSISRAITVIGLKELRNLVITTSVTSSFKEIPADLVDMELFWYHSVTSAILTKNIAKKLKYLNYEGLFIGGLLHSVGRLIYFTQCPDIAVEILAMKDQGEEALVIAEQEKLGFTYAELSAKLLKKWKIPENIWQVINCHLNPLAAENYMGDACVLHIASKIAASIEPCVKYAFDFKTIEPKFQKGVLDYLQLSEDQMQSCTDEAVMQAFDVLSIVNQKATSIL